MSKSDIEKLAEAIVTLAVVAGVLALAFAAPLGVIWAVNVLHLATVPYTVETWAAVAFAWWALRLILGRNTRRK